MFSKLLGDDGGIISFVSSDVCGFVGCHISSGVDANILLDGHGNISREILGDICGLVHGNVGGFVSSNVRCLIGSDIGGRVSSNI